MQHILSVAFDFDDERITKSIEGQVHKEVVDNITNEIKQIIYRKRWTGYVYEKEDPEPLRKMVENNVKDIIDKHRNQIIDMAANKLADSLRRSKAVKEAVGYVLDENID